MAAIASDAGVTAYHAVQHAAKVQCLDFFKSTLTHICEG
jgi:hypothetical protein